MLFCIYKKEKNEESLLKSKKYKLNSLLSRAKKDHFYPRKAQKKKYYDILRKYINQSNFTYLKQGGNAEIN